MMCETLCKNILTLAKRNVSHHIDTLHLKTSEAISGHKYDITRKIQFIFFLCAAQVSSYVKREAIEQCCGLIV